MPWCRGSSVTFAFVVVVCVKKGCTTVPHSCSKWEGGILSRGNVAGRCRGCEGDGLWVVHTLVDDFTAVPVPGLVVWEVPAFFGMVRGGGTMAFGCFCADRV